MDVPQSLVETVEVVRLVPQEQVQWIGEQVVEWLIPRTTEGVVEVLKSTNCGRDR